MNMNKALQHLYKAVSGNDTTKVNISKLLVDIHYAMTGVECAVKNNWARIIDSIATNWSGGGGSSDFSTAQVTFINADTTTSPYRVNTFHVSSDRINSLPFTVSEPVTIEVPLYKGKAEMELLILGRINQSYMPTAAGGVSLVTGQGTPKFVVTGDGTITAKGNETN